MAGNGEPRPARLPGDAPQALRQFVACTTDEVELDLGELSWVPRPEAVPDAATPSVSVLDGWRPDRATIRIGYGPLIAIELPATIVDGELRVDASNLGFGIGDEITKWLEAFNATLRNHGKGLDRFDVRGDEVVVTKRTIAPSAATAAAAAPPVTATEPAVDPPSGGGRRTGCLAWVLGGIVALATAVGITLAATGGDDDVAEPATPTSSTTTTTATSTTAAPTTTVSPAPTTTLGDIGAIPSDPTEQQVCGTFPDGVRFADDPRTEVRAAQVVAFSDSLESSGHAGCAPTAGYTSCSPDVLPCSGGHITHYADVGVPGIDHTSSVVDAVTGREGRSKAEHPVYIRSFGELVDDAVARLTATCGGDVLTGEAPVVTGGVTIVEQPLMQFGPCRIERLEILAGAAASQGDIDVLDPESVARAAAQVRDRAFDVGPAEPDPIVPTFDLVVTNPDLDIPAGWDRSAVTLGNTLSLEPPAADCFWFFDPDNTDVIVKVLDACATNDHFWVFYAATTNVEFELRIADTPIGTAGHFVNPLGTPGPTPDSLQPFGATSGPYFDDTIYPCGYGHLAYVACPDDGAPMEAGGFVTVTAAMLDTVPIEGDDVDRRHSVDFGPSGGPRYEITQSAEGWTVETTGQATRARALFRDNAIMLVVPQDELPAGALTYVWATTVDGRIADQPVLPVDGIIRTPTFGPADTPDETVETVETVEAFYAQLSPSIASGDRGFALERLHPIVFEAYPTQCPASLASFADPDFEIEVIEALEPEPWTWELPDGRSYVIPDAIGVDVILRGRGQSGEPTLAHVALVDGTYRWFTFCT